jgi:hypothetical protein
MPEGKLESPPIVTGQVSQFRRVGDGGKVRVIGDRSQVGHGRDRSKFGIGDDVGCESFIEMRAVSIRSGKEGGIGFGERGVCYDGMFEDV